MSYAKFAPRLVELGYDVTPLKGKRPFLDGWQTRPDGALDFQQYKDANIGVVLGGQFNLVALDIDVYAANVADYIHDLAVERFGGAPCRIGMEPKRMLILRCSEPWKKLKTSVYDIEGHNGPEKHGNAVEILGEGQQFVASGIHPETGRKYRWPDDSILDIPAAALPVVSPQDLTAFLNECNNTLAKFGKPMARSLSSGKRIDDDDPFPRDLETTTVKLRPAIEVLPNDNLHYDDWIRIGIAIKGAVGEAGLEDFHAWSAKSDKYDAKQTDRAWNSFGTPTNIGAGTIFYHAEEAGWTPPWRKSAQERIEDRLRNATATQPAENQSAAPPCDDSANDDDYGWDDAGDDTADGKPATTFPLLYADGITPTLDTADFVEGLLGVGQMSVVYGASNTGKTFFACDLALHASLGWNWRGKEVDETAVLYIAGEGSHGIRNRVAAFKRKHGIVQGIPLVVVPVAVNFLDVEGDIVRLINSVKAAEADLGRKIGWIVVDTLSRALSGGNENSPEDMGALVKAADAVRNITKAHITFIHHSGKDKAAGARGHSLLRAATDTEIEVEGFDGVSAARVTKQREMEIDPDPMPFKLEQVTLGMNARGKEVTSCVVVAAAEETLKTIGKGKLTDEQQSMMDSLADALEREAGRGDDAVKIDDGRVAVPISAWREAHDAMCGTDHSVQSFGNKVTRLVNARRVDRVSIKNKWLVTFSGQSTLTALE